MDEETPATAVWNRATDFMAGEVPTRAGAGDRNLVDALTVDGAIQANGLSQALETCDVPRAIEAFRWFGLPAVADLLTEAESALSTDHDGTADEELSGRYYALDTESLLTQALERRLKTDPDAFLPV
jgi:hypothetical protein